MTCSIGAATARRRQLVVRVRPDDERLDPALEIARHVLERLAAAIGKLRRDVAADDPPSSRTAISKVERVRSDGFSNSIATCAPASALAVGASSAERPVRLQLRGQIEQPREVVGREIENGQEVFRRRSRRGAGFMSGTRR